MCMAWVVITTDHYSKGPIIRGLYYLEILQNAKINYSINMNIKFIYLAALSMQLLGCASNNLKPLPSKNFDGPLASGKITLNCTSTFQDECNGFSLDLMNKKEYDIELDWNKSFYLKNNQTDGGLYYDGIVISQRNLPRNPDIIFAGATFKKDVIPNINFILSIAPLPNWGIAPMSGASNGVLLTLKGGGLEQRIKLEFYEENK